MHLLSANAIVLIFGFASQLFVAGILPPEDIGRIRILQTYLGIFTIAAGLGFNVSVLKLCSEKRPLGEIKYLYLKAIRISILTIAITYLIITGMSLLKLISPDPVVNKYMIIFSVSLLPLTISAVYMSYLQSRQKIKLYSTIQVFTKLFSIAVIITLTYYLRLEGFIIAIVLGYFLTNLFLARLIRRKLNANVDEIIVPNPLRLHWKYAKYSLGAAITDTLGLGIDIILLNYLISDRTEIGYYGFAITIIGVFRILPSTVWTMAAPHFSENMDNNGRWFQTYRRYNTLLVLSSLLITAVAAIAVPIILSYFLNGKYEESGIYFTMLVVAWGIRNLFVLKASVLFGMGKINLNFYSSFIYLITGVLCIPVLVYFWGVIGAGIGVIFASIIGFISVQYFFYRNRPNLQFRVR